MKQTMMLGWNSYLRYLEDLNINYDREIILHVYLNYIRYLFAYQFAAEYIEENCDVLDIGCAGGHGLVYLSKRSSRVVGLDISRKSLLFAREQEVNGESMNVVEGSASFLPFKGESFDIITSFQVIEHLDKREAKVFLREVGRCLKRNGIFICSTPNKKLRLLPFQRPWNPEHKKEYDQKEFERLLKSFFGFVESYGINASDEITAIEKARVKQTPIGVYFSGPAYKLLSRILPKAVLTELSFFGKLVLENRKDALPEISKYTMEDFSIDDFRIDRNCQEDALDFLAFCKKRRIDQHY